MSQVKWLRGSTTTAHPSSCSPRKAVLEQQGRTHSQHLDVQSRDVTLQVLLGLHLLVQLVLQAVPLVLQLPQLGGHVELLPGFFLKQLLGVLELGPKGRHVLGQFYGLPLSLVEHPCDALHFILRTPRDFG